ncbi:MAG: hypothetical protein HUK40_04930 [Desulfobacter sp.]|nr:hypothetical protein [Desulfobacter sp.]
MQNTAEASFNELVEKYLGGPLPRDMTDRISMSEHPAEAKKFVVRALKLMNRSNYPITSLSPYFIHWLSTIKTILPSAWGGQIPPITLPDRHRKLDAYIKNQTRFKGKKALVFLDMGCGFPPITASDTAKALTDWQVYGVDYSFPDYIVYDKEGHYACFDKSGRYQYFQALMSRNGRALYQDPTATRKYFTRLFSTLKDQGVPFPGKTLKLFEKDGCRLIRNHVLNFESENLCLIKSDIKDIRLPPVMVIRCMNVHVYFDPDTRKKMVAQAGKFLERDGLMIVGTNGLAIQARYFVYEKKKEGLACKAFAFSPDNLGPISFMPWFTLHENDPEALALSRLSRIIRSHETFWPEFSNAVDRLLAEKGICRRRGDHFFQVPAQELLPREYMARGAAIWQELDSKGYVDGAVEVLNKAGYEAWKNPVGDIAVNPLSVF